MSDRVASPVFEFGPCRTVPSGRIFSRPDYLGDDPYSAGVADMLGRLGLPWPDKEIIHHGKFHDMLFLNSHGVVVRVGPTDVQDLMNPGILQPLGWLEDLTQKLTLDEEIEAPLCVAIYGGIGHEEDFRRWLDQCPENIQPRFLKGLGDFLKESGQGAADIGGKNNGVLCVPDGKGDVIAVAILLDSDNACNGSSISLAQKRAAVLGAQAVLCKNKADAIGATLREVFSRATGVSRYYLKAFEAHQPLRRMFWQAFSDPQNPDLPLRQAFWDACAARLNNPQDGLGLYRPWTKKREDRMVCWR